MGHVLCFSILLLIIGILSRLAKCQFQQWYPAQQPAQWAWQQPVVQQQPWHHHHHHEDYHHHHHPPPVIVHHDDHHDDHHHHHVAHYPPIRNNANGNNVNANHQAVIPYRQEQFSPLGVDFSEAAEAAANIGASSTPAEFQEQLPELFRPPTFIDQLPTDQQQNQQKQTPNLNGGGVNNAFFAHNKPQQQHTIAVVKSRPGVAVSASQQHLTAPSNGNVGTKRRITTASVRLPAQPAPMLNNGSNNGNKFGANGSQQLQQQLRKVLLLTGGTTTTTTTTTVPPQPAAETAATATTTTGAVNNGKAKLITKRPTTAVGGPPGIAPPKHGPPHLQAVPAKEKTAAEPAIVREFDLPPPPPPSRFLPDVEKLRIAELLRQKTSQHNFRHDVDSENIHSTDDEITKFPTLLSTISTFSSSTTETPATTVTTTTTTTVATTATTVRQATSTLARLLSTAATVPKNPNESFLQCCRAKRVPKSCESRCNFDVLSKKTLTALFLNTDKCPSENGLELFTCAAQDSDHTDCCKTKRVQRTAAGNKCLAFCNLSPEAPRVQADASYLPCWAVLNEIKNCFRDKLAAKLQI